MTNEMQSLVLEHLRHIRLVVDDTRADVKQLNLRVGLLEHRFAASELVETARTTEIDRIKERLERIERRLQLAD
ncbi:MAG: hypothetical protein EKK41_15515 [Hyphomicrobiales bacterium]|nr:MAG: hypothetical protein EKK41_15515 [Hyphomicrobiales bacterium]